jgi:hypothetical protein
MSSTSSTPPEGQSRSGPSRWWAIIRSVALLAVVSIAVFRRGKWKHKEV